MSELERKQLLKQLDKTAKKVKTNKVAGRKFLVSTGILNEDGKLTKPYKSLCIQPA